MRLFIYVPFLLAACSGGNENADSETLIRVIGKIENTHLDEASGLARSTRTSNLYWSVNDDGPGVVHALDDSGKNLGQVRVGDAKNRDWEDIASFSLDNTAYLLIADIGDNGSKYEQASLYIIEEPAPDDDRAEIAWQLDYRYPDGPRDAEAVAVDPTGQHIYVLSKRDVPARLFRLPLLSTTDAVLIAEQVGLLNSLPQPNDRERRKGASNGWHWQPTAMDFAPDGSSALVLTYGGVNYFSRDSQQSWPQALQGQALHLPLGRYRHAESITYSSDGNAAIVTVEKKGAPVLRIDLSGVDKKKASPKAGL